MQPLRALVRGAAAAPLLLQQPVRRVSHLSRLRQPDRGRPRSRGARQAQEPGGRCDRALEQASLPEPARPAAALRAPARDPARRAVVVPRRGPPPARAGGGRRLHGCARLLPLARGAQVSRPGARLPGALPRLPGVPRVLRGAPAARGAAGADRRALDPRRRGDAGRRGAPFPARPAAGGRREGRCGTRAPGGGPAAGVPRGRRARLPGPRPRLGLALGRRVAADRTRGGARHRTRRHAVRAGRAVGGPAPARHRPPDRDPEGAARPGQHGRGRGARHGARGGRRPRDRPRPRGRRAGRQGGLPGADARSSRASRAASPPSTCAAICGSRCRRGGGAATACS